MKQDREQLRILAICHYVYAGLLALGSCFSGLYLFMGVMMLSIPTTGVMPRRQERRPCLLWGGSLSDSALS